MARDKRLVKIETNIQNLKDSLEGDFSELDRSDPGKLDDYNVARSVIETLELLKELVDEAYRRP